MKHPVKMLFVLFVTVICLTSDTTTSSRPATSVKVNSSVSCAASVGTTPMPRYLEFPSWESTVCSPMEP